MFLAPMFAEVRPKGLICLSRKALDCIAQRQPPGTHNKHAHRHQAPIDKHGYNTIVVTMLPVYYELKGSPWAVLPAGVHVATLSEVEARFATNPGRRTQFRGLVAALANLRGAGCTRVFLDGSFVTAKPQPGDFDACWDPTGVNPAFLDPVLLTFENSRAAQKAKYHGELFPSTFPADAVGTVFIKFFQVDRFTGASKGIVEIDLITEPMLHSTVTP